MSCLDAGFDEILRQNKFESQDFYSLSFGESLALLETWLTCPYYKSVGNAEAWPPAGHHMLLDIEPLLVME